MLHIFLTYLVYLAAAADVRVSRNMIQIRIPRGVTFRVMGEIKNPSLKKKLFNFRRDKPFFTAS